MQKQLCDCLGFYDKRHNVYLRRLASGPWPHYPGRMVSNATSRWLIIGNSGSGKSTLAERVGAALHLPIFDLDLIHWHLDGCKRDEADAKVRVAGIASADGWIVEGVYGWLAQVALARATTLIWLDLPWDDCRDGLLDRGLRRGMTPSDQDALLAWAKEYWTRTSPSSSMGHGRLYRAFQGDKAHLHTRDEVAAFLRQPRSG
jgi:hypothetical protein